ncbi:MAG: hypothetical protein AAF902_09730 [Chloroflexota bacterium]
MITYDSFKADENGSPYGFQDHEPLYTAADIAELKEIEKLQSYYDDLEAESKGEPKTANTVQQAKIPSQKTPWYRKRRRYKGGETLYRGLFAHITKDGPKDRKRGFWGFAESDGPLKSKVGGYLMLMATPIPTMIAFLRRLTPEERWLAGLLAAFTFVMLAVPVLVRSEPMPSDYYGPSITAFSLVSIPIIIGLAHLNFKGAGTMQSAAFWGFLLGNIGRYGVFLSTGYW